MSTTASQRPAPAIVSSLPLEPIEDALWLKLLLYGPSGVGKTSLAGTALDDERMSPVLFVDSEGGLASIGWRKPERLPSTNVRATLRMLRKHFEQGGLSRDGTPYRTIVIDSLSDLAERLTRELATGELMERQDWGRYDNYMRDFVRYLCDLPVHLIVTCTERENTDGTWIEPGIKGSIRSSIPYYFGTVARMTTKARPDPKDPKARIVERFLTLQAETRFLAKDRMDPHGVMPREMLNPTATKLMERLTAGQQAPSS